MSQPYPTLDDKRIIRDAAAGNVYRTDTDVDLHRRSKVIAPVRVDLAKHRDAGWLEFDTTTSQWRPTPLGANIAGINTQATRTKAAR